MSVILKNAIAEQKGLDWLKLRAVGERGYAFVT